MKLEEIQAALREEKLDGWLFFDHHVRDLLSYRVLGLDPAGHYTRRWYYYVPAVGEPVGLVHRVEPHSLAALPGKKRYYSQWTEHAAELQSMLRKAERVAMQYSPNCAVPYVSMVDAGTMELIRGFGVDVVSSANLIQLFEARWTAAQLESHLEAGRRMDGHRRAAFDRIGEHLRLGERVTELDIQRFLRHAFAGSGLITDHGPIVAVNGNASDPHYGPTEHKHSEIRKGDVVLIDMWAKLDEPDSTYYDITWTGFCGPEARPEVVGVFEIVRDARDLAVACAKKAPTQVLCGFDIDNAARDHITAAGLGQYFVHRTGHSIGTEVHGTGANMDNFETHDDRRIIPRCCFSVEPGIYLPEFGIRSEVNVYISETEAIVTGEAQRELVTIV